jgi:hypothetical protein
MIAPCGMNCALCSGHQRTKNRCEGCYGPDDHKPNHCVTCRIKTCEVLAPHSSEYCYECEKFSCARLRQLDKRYRTKYGMSMVDNLREIQQIGIEEFTACEAERWKCSNCGELLSVHREACVKCGE